MIRVKNLEAEIENMGKENRMITQEHKQKLNTIEQLNLDVIKLE